MWLVTTLLVINFTFIIYQLAFGKGPNFELDYVVANIWAAAFLVLHILGQTI
jgi:hypothetical protein